MKVTTTSRLSRVKLLALMPLPRYHSCVSTSHDWLHNIRVSLAVLLHHLEETLTLLFMQCQFQVKLLHQRDASFGQIVGDTHMCHFLGCGDITLVVGAIPTRSRCRRRSPLHRPSELSRRPALCLRRPEGDTSVCHQQCGRARRRADGAVKLETDTG